MIVITRREFSKAWVSNLNAFNENNTGSPYFLLLFYAVECGLKSLLLKRLNRTHSDGCDEIEQCQHNINRLLDKLHAGSDLRLSPETIELKCFNSSGVKKIRTGSTSKLNQIWRYGLKVEDDIEREIVGQLEKIAKWIKEQ